MAKESKISVTIEIDEETLRELFEEVEIRFSKKKVKDIQDQIDEGAYDEIEERTREVIQDLLQDL